MVYMIILLEVSHYLFLERMELSHYILLCNFSEYSTGTLMNKTYPFADYSLG